jgi:hypothetical protein
MWLMQEGQSMADEDKSLGALLKKRRPLLIYIFVCIVVAVGYWLYSQPRAELQAALKLDKKGFGQFGTVVQYAFIVEFSNTGSALTNSSYEITAYNAVGEVVREGSGRIDYLAPGQKLGVAKDLVVDEGVTVSNIEVQLRAGEPTAADAFPEFTVDTVAYFADLPDPQATGLVSNPAKRGFSKLLVYAVAYDSAGNIVGGGYTYLDFILPNSKAGVSVYVTALQNVASVELYPTASVLSAAEQELDSEVPTGASSLVLAKRGFGQEGHHIAYAFVVQNPNDGYSIEACEYQLTAYAANGKVIAVEERFFDVVLPRQTFGVGGETYAVSDDRVDHIDIQIKPRWFSKSDAQPFLTAQNVSYHPDKDFPKVTGQIVSTHAQSISKAHVFAVAYNKQGEIVGGGSTFLDSVPANGHAEVEVYVTTAGVPDHVELYAAP